MRTSTPLTPRWAAAFTLLSACTLSASASAQVADSCVNAPLYTFNAVVPFDTNNCVDTGAPATDSLLTSTCGDLYNETWVRYVAHHTGPVLLSTCNNATFDTRLVVATQPQGCGSGLTEWACNDDGSAACTGGTSEVTFLATVGTTYYVLLAGTNSSAWGTGTMYFTALTQAPLADTCAEPNVLTGLSSDTADTTTASTSTFDGGGGVCGTGAGTITGDVFWRWTAQEDGDYTFDTEGSSFDTKLSVHSGTDCSASCLAYNDDISFSNLQSTITLTDIVAGDELLVQVGGYNGANGNAVINVAKDPCAGVDDAYAGNDSCLFAFPFNVNVTNPTVPGLVANIDHKDFWALTVASGATIEIDVLFDNSLGDIDCFLRFADDPNCGTGNGAPTLAQGYTSTDNESISWTNNTGACAEGNLILEVNVYDSPSNQNCNGYDLVIRNQGVCNFNVDAERFCDPMDVNSTGVPTILRATSLFPSNVISLQATDGPAGQFGYFLVSSATNEPGLSLGSGRFCLGGAFGRYNIDGTSGDLNSLGQFNLSGTLKNLFSNGDPQQFNFGFAIPSSLPFAGSPVIQSGSTWHFQLWHREAGGDSNFSNGLSVSFP